MTVRLHSDATPSLPRWLLSLAVDWALLGVALFAPGWAMQAWGPWGALVFPVAAFVIGNRQHALGVLGHEGAHRLISRTRWLNDGLTNWTCFWPLFAEVHVYRPFHLTHHRRLNTPEDPENDYRLAGAPHWDLPTTLGSLVRRCLWDSLGAGFPEAWRIRQFMGPQTLPAAWGQVGFALALVALGLATGHWWIPILWYWSLGTTFVGMWRFRCWLEHAATPHTHRLHLNLWQRWLISPHNIWIHWEHHTMASVPYWALPELRRQAPEVPVMSLMELFELYARSQPIPSGTPSLPDPT